MFIIKQLITIFISISLCHSVFAITEKEYKSGVFPVEINPKDIEKKIRAKNGISYVQETLRKLRSEINNAGKTFGIDPLHIAAAIAGEHAMNVDLVDTTQNKMLAIWLGKHEALDVNLYEMIQTPAFQECHKNKSDYDYWYCAVKVWHKVHGTGITFGSHQFFKKFTREFFNPNGIGSTFGVGQMSPLRVLMVDDMVQKRVPSLKINFEKTGDIRKVYESVLDPNKVVYFIAATIKFGISTYAQVAHFDISKHPGITATLYNIGQEKIKARQKYDENISLLRSGQEIKPPRPNDLGRWVIQNQDMIEDSIR